MILKITVIIFTVLAAVALTAQQPESPVVSLEVTEIDDDDYVRIFWQAVENARSYKVYRSTDPYEEEWGRPVAIVERTEFIERKDNVKRFYYVVASTALPPAEMFRMELLRSGDFFTRGDEANPPHPVNLTRQFYAGKYPVTQEEWVSVMDRNPSDFSDFYGDNHPVESVTWYDVIKFCNLLSLREDLTPVYTINGSTDPDEWGEVPDEASHIWDAAEFNYNANGYRLLTDVEWEYASRSEGRENFTYAGSNDIDEVAWYQGNSDLDDGHGRRTHSVGQKESNGQGLYDMSGNVREWVWDWYGNPYPSGAIDPTGQPPGRSRVLRGGSFSTVDTAAGCAVNHRSTGAPFGTAPFIGFRLARNAE